jgi:hypothetical protein
MHVVKKVSMACSEGFSQAIAGKNECGGEMKTLKALEERNISDSFQVHYIPSIASKV